MNSKTISPQEVSKALDTKDSGSVGVEGDASEGISKTGGDNSRGECMPIEEEEDAIEDQVTEEAAKIKVRPTPNLPSRQEALEHNCTHIPFRNWCQHCVGGKSKAGHHRAGVGMSESETPVVSFDYAFLGDGVRALTEKMRRAAINLRMRTMPLRQQFLLVVMPSQESVAPYRCHKRAWT